MALSSIMCQNYVNFCDKQHLEPETCGNQEDEEQLHGFPRIQTCMHYKKGSLKHWEMALHCENVAFPQIQPKLCSTSRAASFYWQLYAAAAKHLPLYQREVNNALQHSLPKMIKSGRDRTCICLSNQLLRLDTFDHVNRRRIMNKLEQLLETQSTLESVCLEGLSLSNDEGVRLLLALYNSRKTMKYLYCWRAFARTKSAGLMLGLYSDCVTECYEAKELRKCDLLRAIGCLESLTVLSVNYSYVASPTGDILVNLSKALGEKWLWLQLLCTQDDINGGHVGCCQHCVSLPAATWSTIKLSSPALRVQYAIVNVPEYDRHKGFFAKTSPVHTIVLTTGTGQNWRHLYFADCTMKTLYAWYADTLVYLHLHFWHQRDDMDSHLAKLFLRLPALAVFEFAGEIRKLKPLSEMCHQIQTGQCNVCNVDLQLQKVVHGDVDNTELSKSIDCLLKCYREEFQRINVKFFVSYEDN